MNNVDIGLSTSTKKQLEEKLKDFLSDSYTLYLLTRKEFAKLRPDEEIDGLPIGANTLKILTDRHEKMLRTARVILEISQNSMDKESVFLVSDRVRIHEKTVWMLKAMTTAKYSTQDSKMNYCY